MSDHAPRYPSYDPDTGPYEDERYEENPTIRPLAPYQARQSTWANYPDRVPLYLSDSDGVPDPSEYITPLMKVRASYYVSRVLLGALCGIVVAGLAALISSESARDLVASAKASSVAALSVASVAMQTPSKAPAATPGETTQAVVAEAQPPAPAGAAPVAGGSAVAGTVMVATATPTQDDIKTAYQSAAQGGTGQAAAAPESTPPSDVIRHLDAGEIAALIKRAEVLIGSGDVAASRLVLRRAAEAGDAHATMMLGGTYDPAVLERLGVRGVVPDMATARSWYDKAKRFGATEATPQLDLLAKKQN